MTGRSWRHFSVFWPFMVAGALGPSVAHPPATLDGAPVAPTGSMSLARTVNDNVASDMSSASSSEGTSDHGSDVDSTATNEFDDGWGAVPGDVFEVADEPAGELPHADLISTRAYKETFPGMSLHDAFLETFCRAARLGGLLFGDNMPNPNITTEAEVNTIEELAKELGVDAIQTLYGHVNTTKLHRLIQHLGDELRSRGNLWEGDTSVNEKLHGSCKRMFKRSNKRGPGVALQMMRCDESQSAIIRELVDADEESASQPDRRPLARGISRAAASRQGGGHRHEGDDNGGSGASAAAPVHLVDGASDVESTTTPSVGSGSGSGASDAASPSIGTADLPFSGRGRRVAVGDLRETPALAAVGELLSLDDDAHVTVHNTVRIMARFEWGSPPALQHLRAAGRFHGRSWYSFVRYFNDGQLRWGRMLLVLRSLGNTSRSCVVVQRMRPAAHRPGCILTRYGCVRLQWDFVGHADDFPALELVDSTDIWRAEDVQVDWQDLGDRLGLRATPSNKTVSTAERRASRYWTNAFYPWTSRDLSPGL